MLFIPIKFKTQVYLSPPELDARYQDRLVDKLKKNYEGICTKHGFIKPGSIEIVKKSPGTFIKEYFNGFIKFELQCKAETCNPVQGSVVSGVIKNKNQLGILAESSIDDMPILDIIIPIKTAGIISQVSLDTLQIGDTISVEVMGKKFQMTDKKISVIGRVIQGTEESVLPLPEEEEEVEPDLEEEVYLEEEEKEEEEKKTLEVKEEKAGGEEEEEEEEISDVEASDEENEEYEGGEYEDDLDFDTEY
jgi:DNA-directed RNA polymerase subunit E'/Rpb7